MNLPIQPPYLPMEASVGDAIPEGPQWQYEPKWDGFRCLAFRDYAEVQLQSKSAQPLGRYFPELLEALSLLQAERFVLDGEIVIPQGGNLDFDQLLQRIHPAESRIRKLSQEHPAVLIVFDLLVDQDGNALVELSLAQRRPKLQEFAAQYFGQNSSLALSPATKDLAEARGWYQTLSGGLDGIIAKGLDLPYQTGERGGMRKIKNLRTADCVIGGFRYGQNGKEVGSLLLGLYGDDELLHHVGFCSSILHKDRPALTAKLEAARGGAGFTGRAPGGPSRWSTQRSTEWEPLRPELVVEVQYDHFTGGRFRHGTKLLHWRPDKAARQCTMAQVERESKSPLGLLSS